MQGIVSAPCFDKWREELPLVSEKIRGHENNKANPHSVTASQTGALPAGGTAVNSSKWAGYDQVVCQESERAAKYNALGKEKGDKTIFICL